MSENTIIAHKNIKVEKSGYKVYHADGWRRSPDKYPQRSDAACGEAARIDSTGLGAGYDNRNTTAQRYYELFFLYR